MATAITPAFAELLEQAVTKPGTLSSAYRLFHSYSLGNVLLAAFQCAARQIPLGPMATYPRWKELGRHVKKGEKALTLCQPVTVKTKGSDGQDDEVRPQDLFDFRMLVAEDGADRLAAQVGN